MVKCWNRRWYYHAHVGEVESILGNIIRSQFFLAGGEMYCHFPEEPALFGIILTHVCEWA